MASDVCVKVYFSKEAFTAICSQAEKAGKRRVGLLHFTQKKNGFANQKVANTDGIAKHLKFCATYYRDTEAQRLKLAAELAVKEKEIAKQKKELGL